MSYELIKTAKQRITQKSKSGYRSTLALGYLTDMIVSGDSGEAKKIIYDDKKLDKYLILIKNHQIDIIRNQAKKEKDTNIELFKKSLADTNIVIKTIRAEFQSALKDILKNTDRKSARRSNIAIGLTFFILGNITSPISTVVLKKQADWLDQKLYGSKTPAEAPAQKTPHPLESKAILPKATKPVKKKKESSLVPAG